VILPDLLETNNNSQLPLVTVITATYNSEKYLKYTVESILKQSYENIEYLILDGGSTDSTLDIIRKYECFLKGKLRWFTEKDEGIYDAFNKGIKLSKGDIIGILNSDDWYEEDIISEVVREIKGYDMLHGNLRFFNAQDKVLKIYSQKKGRLRKYISTPFNHPTMFVKRYVYDTLGSFNLKYYYAADYDFMLRFINSGFKDYYSDKIITNMRTVGVTTSADCILKPEEIKEVLIDNGLPPAIASFFVGYRIARSKLYHFFKKYPRLIELQRKLKPYHINQNRTE
jgi:glycosyltransferase involved in cell wall biosynthesis